MEKITYGEESLRKDSFKSPCGSDTVAVYLISNCTTIHSKKRIGGYYSVLLVTCHLHEGIYKSPFNIGNSQGPK